MSAYVKQPDGFIINTDDSQYRAILTAREHEKRAKEAEEKFSAVCSELAEIRDLLKKITDK